MVISTAHEKTPMEIPLGASSNYFPWNTTTTWLQNERLVHQADKEINHLLALCRVFDVIKQLSTL